MTSSLTLVAYCVGNMIGAQIFRTKDAPRYVAGTITCCACFGLEVFVIILWRLWYVRENRRRDALASESGLSKEEQERQGRELGDQDVTDLRNPHFRYSMWFISRKITNSVQRGRIGEKMRCYQCWYCCQGIVGFEAVVKFRSWLEGVFSSRNR